MSLLGNDSTHFHYFFITVAFLIGTKACEVGAKKGRKGGEKQERKSEREKKGKRKGAVLFPSFPNPLFLYPSLPPSLPPHFSFESSYTDIRTVNLLLFFNLRNLRQESFEDWEGVRQ